MIITSHKATISQLYYIILSFTWIYPINFYELLIGVIIFFIKTPL